MLNCWRHWVGSADSPTCIGANSGHLPTVTSRRSRPQLLLAILLFSSCRFQDLTPGNARHDEATVQRVVTAFYQAIGARNLNGLERAALPAATALITADHGPTVLVPMRALIDVPEGLEDLTRIAASVYPVLLEPRNGRKEIAGLIQPFDRVDAGPDAEIGKVPTECVVIRADVAPPAQRRSRRGVSAGR